MKPCGSWWRYASSRIYVWLGTKLVGWARILDSPVEHQRGGPARGFLGRAVRAEVVGGPRGQVAEPAPPL